MEADQILAQVPVPADVWGWQRWFRLRWDRSDPCRNHGGKAAPGTHKEGQEVLPNRMINPNF